VIATISRYIAVFVLAVSCSGPLLVSVAAAQTQPAPKDEYVPVSQLPPQEQFPAARLVISAYSFVIVVLFLYVVTVARRLTAVQREVERLEADVKRTSRA
jgi:CcmD family protein